MAFTIGTISFARCGDTFSISASERVRLIRSAAYHYAPTLLLTAGHALRLPKHLVLLSAGLAEDGSGTTIVTEVHHDGGSRRRVLSNHAIYVANPDGAWLRMGRQVFSKRSETVGENGWRVSLFAARAGRRLIEVLGHRVFVLGCGEINVVLGRDHPRFIDPSIGEAISGSDIILNPTHDRMGRAGLLDAKRRFLSATRSDGRFRAYVSCSNWNLCHDSGVPQYPSATLHTCYVDGTPVAPTCVGGGREWGFVYRQYTVP